MQHKAQKNCVCRVISLFPFPHPVSKAESKEDAWEKGVSCLRGQKGRKRRFQGYTTKIPGYLLRQLSGTIPLILQPAIDRLLRAMLPKGVINKTRTRFSSRSLGASCSSNKSLVCTQNSRIRTSSWPVFPIRPPITISLTRQDFPPIPCLIIHIIVPNPINEVQVTNWSSQCHSSRAVSEKKQTNVCRTRCGPLAWRMNYVTNILDFGESTP